MSDEPLIRTSMETTVHYFTVLRKLTGKRQERIKLKVDSTIEDMLILLIGKYGEPFRQYVSPSKRKEGLQLVLLLNNRDVTQLDGLKTLLHDGDEVSLILPIAGG